jgi:anti-sigma B factor antagonist
MSLPPDRPLVEEIPGDVVAVRLNIDYLGEPEIDSVRTSLFGLAEARPGKDLRVDLGSVEYLTSTGLALFVALHQKVRDGGGRLSLRNVRDQVHELFAITRLTDVLDIHRQ